MAKGVLIKEPVAPQQYYEALLDTSAQPLTTGTTTFRLSELQSDGGLHLFDFDDFTFKSAGHVTPSQSATHQQSGGVDLGIWSYVLSDVTGFTEGNLYVQSFENAAASPTVSNTLFQFGGAESNMLVDVNGYLQTNTSAHSNGQDALTLLQGYNVPEPTAGPPALADLFEMIGFLYAFFMNDTSSNPTQRILRDSAGTAIATATSSFDANTQVFNQGRLQ